jgi:hypothetical protein
MKGGDEKRDVRQFISRCFEVFAYRRSENQERSFRKKERRLGVEDDYDKQNNGSISLSRCPISPSDMGS